MTGREILYLRLRNQQLTNKHIKTTKELVAWFGAVQSQDFPAAIWALGQRLNSKYSDIEKAYEDGEILRTHVMRPTWHFVSSDDIYWMLELTRERVMAVMRSYERNFGLDEKIINKSIKILEKELDRTSLTKIEIGQMFKKNGISWKENGLAHILIIAESRAIITSGPIKNKKTTYALLTQRVPKIKTLTREKAISEIVKRYFQSHGPAQLKDFAWWSGLTIRDGLAGIEVNKEIKNETVDGKTYYFYPAKIEANDKIFLLPNYDEYTVAYRDRRLLTENVDFARLDSRQNPLFNNVVIIDGKVEGVWKKIPKSKEIVLDLRLFRSLNLNEKELLNISIEKYSSFLNIPIKLQIT